MVSVTDYKKVPSSYVTVDIIKSKSSVNERRAVIVGGGEYKTFSARKGRDGRDIPEQSKLVIPVEMGGLKYDFAVSKDSANQLSKDVGSDNSDDWVGSVIQFSVAGGAVPYVTVVVIDVPKKGVKN